MVSSIMHKATNIVQGNGANGSTLPKINEILFSKQTTKIAIHKLEIATNMFHG